MEKFKKYLKRTILVILAILVVMFVWQLTKKVPFRELFLLIVIVFIG